MWQSSYIGEFLKDDLIHTAYICCFFSFDASLKKLFLSRNYHVLFVCLTPMVFKVNNANIQYFLIFLDIQIMRKHFALQHWQSFFHDYSYQKYGLFFSFVGLILWLKVHLSFNNLHNLKIILCECKMSFKKICSLRCSAWQDFIHWSSFHRFLPVGFTVFLIKKYCKIKYGF